MNHTDTRHASVAEAIELVKKADEARSTAIQQLLAHREQIELDLKTLGYMNGYTSKNGHVVVPPSVRGADGQVPPLAAPSRRFRGMTLAEVGKILLTEHSSLHGKKIEELAKAGGFKGGTKNFQNYMPVAFKRDGGFKNIGGNTWKLKESPTA